ncbi:PREDICTED: uncharacterized protein LOC105959686 [Erythranthe guttata]|uniref:uncharacterized protein LOC105959686 n=1 Tax=Erythranthe guttata TaxID=4155 RepID=UPI00064E0A19|nr:PREDICTED: uncharacterized protein LOC105959686 [Erythranthe guttata]|eukprot:XP_012839280.1 PREDICTED: uncharacterized protein LOC105959686 [Erythranthe guttata]
MNSSGNKKTLGVRKTDKTRRSWSVAEEQALINGLKDLVLTGWKCDNGFKSGFLGILQHHMLSAFSGTDIRADPHINSKIHVWKKTYGSLSTMMTRSGFGWWDATNTIDVESDDVWDTYVKTYTNARTMRHKSFPFYKDWLEIFGKDRATGENAEDFVDMVQTMGDKVGIDNEGGGDYVPEMPFNLQEEATEFHPTTWVKVPLALKRSPRTSANLKMTTLMKNSSQ